MERQRKYNKKGQRMNHLLPYAEEKPACLAQKILHHVL
jgi:hypothetical protein